MRRAIYRGSHFDLRGASSCSSEASGHIRIRVLNAFCDVHDDHTKLTLPSFVAARRMRVALIQVGSKNFLV